MQNHAHASKYDSDLCHGQSNDISHRLTLVFPTFYGEILVPGYMYTTEGPFTIRRRQFTSQNGTEPELNSRARGHGLPIARSRGSRKRRRREEGSARRSDIRREFAARRMARKRERENGVKDLGIVLRVTELLPSGPPLRD